MPYNGFFEDLVPGSEPIGSRAQVTTSGGSLCFTSASFSFVHGTSPGAGTVTMEDLPYISPGEEVIIEIGFSTFYGYATSLTRATDIKTGHTYTMKCVDTRDRLHDILHFAQYNMIDDSGNYYHTVPWLWADFAKSYIRNVTVAEVQTPPPIEDQIDLLQWETDYISDPDATENLEKRAPPLLTGYQLLDYLGRKYGFNLTATDSAQEILVNNYPESLDFNKGEKLINVIEAILSKLNLQFSVTGLLDLNITQKGVAENSFEDALLSNNVNLCELDGFKSSNYGGELNEKGRRYTVVGDQNVQEWWYYCHPDWNPKYTLEIVNNIGGLFSALLAKNNVTRLSKLSDLPEEWQDPNVHPSDSNLTRNDMSIRDYLEQICFKLYSVSFQTPLILTFTEKDGSEEEQFKKVRDNSNFDPDEEIEDWQDFITDPKYITKSYPSMWAISEKLVSDDERQCIVRKTSRKLQTQGIRDKYMFAEGDRVFTDSDFTVLESTRVVKEGWVAFKTEHDLWFPNDRQNTSSVNNVKIHYYKIQFSNQQISGEFDESEGEEGEFIFKPDAIYARLALKTGYYRYSLGDEEGSFRSRDTIINVPGLRYNFVDLEEVGLLTNKYKQATQPLSVDFEQQGGEEDEGQVTSLKADDVATEIINRKLAHEWITTAGNIQFSEYSGFNPSGIIQSVNLRYNTQDRRNRLTETIAFSNELSDPTTRSLPGGKRKISELLEKDLIERTERENAVEASKILRQQSGNAARRNEQEGFGVDQLSTRFSKDGVILVEIEAGDIELDGDIESGEIIVLSQANGSEEEPYES